MRNRRLFPVSLRLDSHTDIHVAAGSRSPHLTQCDRCHPSPALFPLTIALTPASARHSHAHARIRCIQIYEPWYIDYSTKHFHQPGLGCVNKRSTVSTVAAPNSLASFHVLSSQSQPPTPSPLPSAELGGRQCHTISVHARQAVSTYTDVFANRIATPFLVFALGPFSLSGQPAAPGCISQASKLRGESSPAQN